MNSDSCFVFTRSSSSADGPSLASRVISAVMMGSIFESGTPGRAVACTTNTLEISDVALNEATAVASCWS